MFFSSELTPLGMTEYVVLDITDKVPGYMGWNFQKDSEFTRFFNYHIIQINEIGLWRKTYRVISKFCLICL